jgi:hypothetical protein
VGRMWMEKYCWAITQAVILRPIRFHNVGVGNSNGLHCLY